MRDHATEEKRAHPWEQAPDGGGVSFGTWLRQQREMRGIALREIANISKISIRYLEALEACRFDVLPAAVFAKGFLRQYASYVGLDPDEVVNYYLLAQKELEPEEERASASVSRMHSSTHWAYGLFLTLGIVLLFGLVALLSFVAEKRSPEAEQPPMAAPVFASPPPQQVSVEESRQAPLVVTLDFLLDCWVEALVDGENRISELRVQGESLQLNAEETITLTLGNARGVRIEVNGEDYPLPKDQGLVISDLEISLESLRGSAPELDSLAAADQVGAVIDKETEVGDETVEAQ